MAWTDHDHRQEVAELFARLMVALPELEMRRNRCNRHWGSEDSVYRFYHQSYRV